jgi:1,2-phenylacetyl-CoA epoxidase PaaB subunit
MSSSYQIVFFKNLLSSDGHPYKCPQQVVTLDAPNAECAIETAKEKFRHDHRLREWRHGADEIEAKEIPLSPHQGPSVS